jgi:ribosomal protein L14
VTHTHKYQDDKDTIDDYKVPDSFGDCEEDDDEDEDGVIVSPDSEGKACFEGISKGEQSSTGQRTVLIRNLPDRVTHEDITDAVRGGALLHIYLRARDHFANVSFVDESAAYAFLRHTKIHGLHVAGKRVDTAWSGRQFYLPSYVRAKINGGASRVLVINNVSPFITEELIRRDLDHIHNLMVISVKFHHGNAYVSTNSIHNTLFARTCMMSRRTYKGMRIAFYPDECAEPLAKVTPKRDMHPAPNKPVSRPNRFQLLSLDGTENEEEEDDYENIHDDLNSHSSVNGGVCWADRI